MLGFFRRMIRSRVGAFVALALLAVIAVGFAVADINGLRGNGAATGNTVAQVGDTKVSDAWLTDRTRRELQVARQQQPALDMTQFLGAGGMESVLERAITGYALEEFAQKSGFVVSERLVDGQIASIPAFQGFDGKFDQRTFEARLAQERVRPDELRSDIRRETLAQWLMAPTVGAAYLPQQIALPYASLLKERRQGQVALVPTGALPAVAEPTDAQLQAYYTANRGRYTVPERRVVRYAVVTPASIAQAATPTDAELQQAFRANPTRFGASERRDVTQVVVGDQAAAAALAARVRGGASIADAARGAGLEATTLAGLTRAELATRSAPAVAEAAFGAARGAVVGPLRAPLGFVVARVDAVTTVAARTLEQARPELVAELTATKTATLLGQAQERIDANITEGATFDEIVADAKLSAQRTPPITAAAADAKLSAQRTPPITAAGVDPERPAQPDPALAQVVAAGFAAEQGDAPQIVQNAPDGSFAVVATDQVVAAAPRPLTQIRQAVAEQYRREQALRAARQVAAAIVAKANGGTPLARAIAEANPRIPAPRPLNASRSDLANLRGQVPPALGLMFSMAERKAKLAPAPDGTGWVIVYLDRIERGDAKADAAAIRAARTGIGRATGREYAEQFADAVRRSVGVSRNRAAIARVRSELAGLGTPQEQ